MRLLATILLLAVGAVLGFAVSRGAGDPAGRLFGGGGEVATIASASLKAAQAEARMSVFAARFVVAISSEERQFGLSARRTMIVPATVRYEIDWRKITPADLKWDPAARALIVEVPAVEISAPAVEMGGIHEYGSDGLLTMLTSAEERLTAANRGAIDAAMRKEASNPILLELARKSGREAVERTFALPLAAAGVPAKVVVRFPGEAGRAM